MAFFRILKVTGEVVIVNENHIITIEERYASFLFKIHLGLIRMGEIAGTFTEIEGNILSSSGQPANKLLTTFKLLNNYKEKSNNKKIRK